MTDAPATSTGAPPPPLIARSLSTSALASRRAPALAPAPAPAPAPFAKSALSTTTVQQLQQQRRHSGPSLPHATTIMAMKPARCSSCSCSCSCAFTLAQQDGKAVMTLRNVKRDELLCSICFDVLCFPVTLPCGHNFDRGCILAAWKYDQTASGEEQQTARRTASENNPDDTNDDNENGGGDAAWHRRRPHLCPLCRQEAGICNVNQLQVNLLLKDLIAKLYPMETECAATLEKQQWAACVVVLPQPNRGAAGNSNVGTRYSFRAISSFVYVCVASVTDPPGFVLAVLLLMGLIAIACNPQHVFASNASAATLTVFDVMDHVFNGFSLLIREFSLTLDQLEQLKSWIHAFSFML